MFLFQTISCQFSFFQNLPTSSKMVRKRSPDTPKSLRRSAHVFDVFTFLLSSDAINGPWAQELNVDMNVLRHQMQIAVAVVVYSSSAH